jgi:uncharacterized repeat protein (TIGR02059 family)
LLTKRSLSRILIIVMLMQVWTMAGVASAAPLGSEVHISAAGAPQIISTNPMEGETIEVTDPITFTFNEDVIVVPGGYVRIVGSDGSVQSTPVTNLSTTDMPRLKFYPSPQLKSNLNYYVLIDPGAFVDSDGNPFGGFSNPADWTFQTNSPTIAPPTLDPVNGKTAVSINLTLTMTFASSMHAGTGYIRIKKKTTHATVAGTETRIDNSMLSIGEKILNFKVSSLEPNTQYYVQIDPGALLNANNEPYLGIVDDTTWTFTTATDVTKPIVSLLTPATGGTLASLTGPLTMKFNEAVYPGSGSITIRNSNNTLFCSIPVGSVTGGGTDTITITPCASFVKGNSYSIQVPATAFHDASSNFYLGIAADNYTAWRFNTSSDVTAPELSVTDPVTDATTIYPTIDVLTATFNEDVQVTGGATATLNTATGSVVTPITLTLTRHATDARKVLFTLPSGVDLAVNRVYYVNIPVGAIKDVAGNSFQGILNSYRWSFKTVSSITTAPVLSTVSIEGSVIVLTYNQDLKTTAVPSAAQYYVSVNTLPRTVTSVKVSGKEVRLTLSSGALVGQTVKVSFTNGILSNTGGVLAASFAAKEVTKKDTDTTSSMPRPSGGMINGTILTLYFNKQLESFTSTKAISQFRVRLNGTVYTPTMAYASGNSLTLVLPTAYQDTGAVTVSYTPGVGGEHLRDTTGYAVSSFSEFYIANGNDKAPPIISTGLAVGNKVSLVYNEGLRTTTLPPLSSFSVLVNGETANVLSVVVNNNTVELTVNKTISIGQIVLVTYVPGNPMLADLAGNPAQILSGFQIIAGSSSSTTLTSATLNGNLLTLNYSAALSSAVVPSNAQYAIKVNGSYLGANTVSVSGTQVLLTLTSQVQTGQTVTVTYFASGSLLKDLSNQNVAAFSDYPVTTGSGSSGSGVIVNLPSYLNTDGEGAVQFNSTAVTTQSGTAASGRIINRYLVNSDYLSSAFIWIKSSGSQLTSPRVSVNVPNTEAAAVVQIPIYSLIDASTRVANGSIRVNYGDLRFELPLSAVKYTQEVVAMGGSITNATLQITIEKTTDSQLTNAIGTASAVVLGLPVNFSVKIISAGREAEVTQFDQYVTRTFVVPTSSASVLSQVTVVRMDSTGVLSYVPTVAEIGSDGIHVNFKRKGNSVYAVVRKTPTTFNDMSKHWANEYVSLLASKWIVSGTSYTAYSPSMAITRADFAKYIANGLGLTGNTTSAAKFSDVGVNGKDAAYIGAASDAGVISGKTNGKFDPNAAITREEMASMMLRAMHYAGVQPSNASLDHFTDKSKIGSWATDAVAANVEAGIISGVTPTTFQPKANATRAQAAVMIVKMLQYSELLQE